MMPDGRDLVVAVVPTEQVRTAIRQFVKAHWPRMTVQEDEDDWFFFRDETAQASWDDWGVIDENQDNMFHVAFSKARLTLVSSHLDNAETTAMATELAQQLTAVRN